MGASDVRDTRSKLDKAVKRIGSRAARSGKKPGMTETAIRLSSRTRKSGKGKSVTEIEADLRKEIEANKKPAG